MEEMISLLVGFAAGVLKMSRGREKNRRIHYELT